MPQAAAETGPCDPPADAPRSAGGMGGGGGGSSDKTPISELVIRTGRGSDSEVVSCVQENRP